MRNWRLILVRPLSQSPRSVVDGGDCELQRLEEFVGERRLLATGSQRRSRVIMRPTIGRTGAAHAQICVAGHMLARTIAGLSVWEVGDVPMQG